MGGMREQRSEKAEVWGLNLPLLGVEKALEAKGKSQKNDFSYHWEGHILLVGFLASSWGFAAELPQENCL